jgi:predicted TIM-barrel fold metal-dependent hydrolase
MPQPESNRDHSATSYEVVDAHTHVGRTMQVVANWARQEEIGDQQVDGDEDLALRLAELDRRGVAKAVVIAGHYYERPDGIKDTRRINDEIAGYGSQRPDRICAAVGIVEPVYGARGLGEIDRCKEELGLAGVSFHTRFQGVPVDDIWVARYVERMETIGLLPYVHAVGDSVEEALWKVEALARTFPDSRLLVLDGFSTAEQARFLPYVAERQENLFFDTSLTLTFKHVLSAVARVGAERIVYGSDLYSAPYGSPGGDMVDEIRNSGLPVDDKQAILGGNIRGLLGTYGAVF